MRGFICALWLLISAAHAGTAAEQPVIVDVQREAGNVYRFSMQLLQMQLLNRCLQLLPTITSSLS